MTDRVTRFYESDGGEALVDSTRYPAEIERFLADERRLLLARLGGGPYDALFEIGCMDARSAPIAAVTGVAYYGIDLVPRFVKAGRDRLRQELGLPDHGIAAVSCERIDAGSTPVPAARVPLAVFPFNAFGNVERPEAAVERLTQLGYDFLISTYGVDARSTEARYRYYAGCGYKNVSHKETEAGILFLAREGLFSMAYRAEFFNTLSRTHAMSVTAFQFSEIGYAYFFQLPRSGK